MAYKQIFSNIYQNYGFGSLESRSGPGSTLQETQLLRDKIISIVKEKNIKSVVDIPCGDFNWMKEIVHNFEQYTGGDIVEEAVVTNQEKFGNDKVNFINFDLIEDKIPTADLLIVRDVVGHLPIEDGKKVIHNILNSRCKYLLSTTWAKKTDNGWKKCAPEDVHRENEGVEYGRFYPVNLMSHPFNLPEAEAYLEEDVRVDNFENGNRKVLALWNIESIRNSIKPQEKISDIKRDIESLSDREKNELMEFISQSKNNVINKDITVVTGLWNINRPGRDFDYYTDHFKKLLDLPVNLFVYIEKKYEHLVWEKRNKKNTFVKVYELEDIKKMYLPFWDATQKIRNEQSWFNRTGEGGWLKTSPQASLEFYNPIVQSKMFLLNDVTIWNPFNTEYFLWLDAGINSTVSVDYVSQSFENITSLLNPFLFLSYPYENENEIHGFDKKGMDRYAGDSVKYVCRGGLFGGHKDAINKANGEYYTLLSNTLSEGLMGTEESLFTIMSYLDPYTYRRYELDDNGLIVKFVADKNPQLVATEKPKKIVTQSYIDSLKVSVYVLTFNFPHQVEHTIKKWLKHEKWLTKTRNILIDNSTTEEAREENKKLCEKYGFEHIITNENTGINGGRFLAAKHFQESDSDYYLFLEDDMGIHSPEKAGQLCRNGFALYVPKLHDKVLKIMESSDVDFLKLSFTEVYMDNNIQVSWYNVPQFVRTEVWPDYDKLPVTGLDPNCPRTKFDKIECVDGLSYITGEIYYANWPTVCGKKGNQKMFLDTTWARPYEQTWMSYMFQETRKGNLKPAVLLASPIDHDRIAHYTAEERREN